MPFQNISSTMNLGFVIILSVDYLIYTTEVIGNIMESYPIIPLFTAIFVVTGLATWWIYKKTKDSLLQLPNLVQKFTLLGVLLFYWESV